MNEQTEKHINTYKANRDKQGLHTQRTGKTLKRDTEDCELLYVKWEREQKCEVRWFTRTQKSETCVGKEV